MKTQQQGIAGIWIHERNRALLVSIHNVLFLRADRKYTTIRTPEREHLVLKSLDQFEAEFADRLIRIHRNCLVNRMAVVGFERKGGDWSAVVKGTDDRLPISRRLQRSVRQQFK